MKEQGYGCRVPSTKLASTLKRLEGSCRPGRISDINEVITAAVRERYEFACHASELERR